MKYDAVVFDLDGTLTDSAEGIVRSIQFALKKAGKRVPEQEELLRYCGPPLVQSFVAHNQMDENEAIRATAFYRERYEQIGWMENRVYPGIRALLRSLQKSGVYLAVATGKPRASAETILEYFCLNQYFDSVIGPDETDYHADKCSLILRALNGHKGRAVMIGDRAGDISGAKKAGIDSIGVAYGYGDRNEIEKAIPVSIAETVDSLYEALETPQDTLSKGCFISFEGVDGCGKSTQHKRLADYLCRAGFAVRSTREPGGCPISEKIRAILLDNENERMDAMTEALLFAAARRQHVQEVIRPAITGGKIVLADRFVDSSIAYQGGGRGLGIETVAKINSYAIENCLPDMTYYFDMDVISALKRRYDTTESDRIEVMDHAFYERVERAFKELSMKDSKRYVVINATNDESVVASDVLHQFQKFAKERNL